jgi:predicted membrane metal-binding protein
MQESWMLCSRQFNRCVAIFMQRKIYPTILQFGGTVIDKPPRQKRRAGDWHRQQLLDSDSACPLSVDRQSFMQRYLQRQGWREDWFRYIKCVRSAGLV